MVHAVRVEDHISPEEQRNELACGDANSPRKVDEWKTSEGICPRSTWGLISRQKCDSDPSLLIADGNVCTAALDKSHNCSGWCSSLSICDLPMWETKARNEGKAIQFYTVFKVNSANVGEVAPTWENIMSVFQKTNTWKHFGMNEVFMSNCTLFFALWCRTHDCGSRLPAGSSRVA